MNKEQTLGIIRHVLTFVGGFFVAKGFMDEGTMVEVSAAALTLIGATWSIISPTKQ